MARTLLTRGKPYAYIQIGDTELGPGAIASDPGLTITSALATDDGYSIGGFQSAQLTASVVTAQLPSDLQGKPIDVYMGFDIGTDDEPQYDVIKVGSFYTTEDKIVTKGLFTSITAYDIGYYATGTFTTTESITTVAKALSTISSLSGLAVDADWASHVNMPGTTAVHGDLSGMTYREAIAQCALLLGANAIIDNNEQLTFRIPGTEAIKTYDDGSYNYDDYTLQSNAPYVMGRLTVNYSYEKTTGEGTEDQDTEEVTETYTHQCSGTTSTKGIQIDTTSIQSQAETDALGKAILGDTGLSIYGYSLKVDGAPDLQLGDAITLAETDEPGSTTERSLFIMSHTLTYNGAMSSTFGASIPEADTTSVSTESRSTLSSQVSQLTTNVATLDRLVLDNAVIADAKIENLSAEKADITLANIDLANIDKAKVGQMVADNIDADQISAKVLESETFTTKSAEIADAEIASATIEQAQVKDLSTSYAHITNGKIDNVEIKYADIADVEIDAATIKSLNGKDITDDTVLYAAIHGTAVSTLSGTKTYYSAIDSPPTDAKEGDLWYVTVMDETTAETNTSSIKRLNAREQWEDVALDHTVLVENSITSAEIASGTITADNIAAGTITANNLDLDSLTTNREFVDDMSANIVTLGNATKGTALKITSSGVTVLMDGNEQAHFGEDTVKDAVGVVAPDVYVYGVDAGIRLDNGTAEERLRYVWKVRANGHLSLMRY